MTSDNNTSEDPNINKAPEHLNSVLVKVEMLDAWAIQRRLFAFTNKRILIAKIP